MKGARAWASLALVTTAAGAAALPLKPGTFVLNGQSCSDPPFAAMVHYDEQEFSYPHASRCRSTLLSHVGRVYRRRETCSALGDGTSAEPTTAISSYEVVSPMDVLVSDESHHASSDHRWCSASR